MKNLIGELGCHILNSEYILASQMASEKLPDRPSIEFILFKTKAMGTHTGVSGKGSNENTGEFSRLPVSRLFRGTADQIRINQKPPIERSTKHHLFTVQDLTPLSIYLTWGTGGENPPVYPTLENASPQKPSISL